MIFDGLCDVFRALSAELILGNVKGLQRPIVFVRYPCGNNNGATNPEVLIAQVRLSHASLENSRCGSIQDCSTTVTITTKYQIL